MNPEAATSVLPYEERLRRNRRWGLDEGGLYFEGKSLVQQTLRRIARRLDGLNIPYAIAGGMALFELGYRRFTEDFDILVTRESLVVIHQQLEGLGFVPRGREAEARRIP